MLLLQIALTYSGVKPGKEVMRDRATESAGAVLDYGFKHLALNSIYAITDPRNQNSKKVLHKLGFNYRETFDYEGDLTDWFELEKQDWVNK